MRSMAAVRDQTVSLPQAGLVLLLVLLAHLVLMATPFHLAMMDGDQAVQAVMAGAGDDGHLGQVSLTDPPHPDCAIEWARVSRASALVLLLVGPVLGWLLGATPSTQAVRPRPQANSPPAGDWQALLQVFRL